MTQIVQKRNTHKISMWRVIVVSFGVFLLLTNICTQFINTSSLAQSPIPSAQQATEISQLLEKADAYFEARYFIAPPGENAFEIYQEVLKIDPTNSYAQEKIREMAKVSKIWGDSAYKKNNQDEAKLFYERYLVLAQYISTVLGEQEINAEVQAIQTRLKELGSVSGLEAPTSSDTQAAGIKSPNVDSDNQSMEQNSRDSMPISADERQTGQPQQTSVEAFEGDLSNNPLFLPMIITVGILILTLFGVLIYQFIIRPRRKRRPLNEALEIIDSNVEAALDQADDLLGEAVTGGLNKNDLQEARFFQAYTKARRKKYSEASAVLEDLKKTAKPEREIVYLDMWLRLQQEQYKEVVDLYDQYHKRLGDFLDSKLIAGIAYLHLGQRRWDSREIKAAVQYFDRLKSLNVLTEHIPEHIDDHQIVLGIASLFDRRFEEASEFFDGAVEDAEKAGKPAFEGRLGQLLCVWREEDYPDIDDDLGRVIEEMEHIIQIQENGDIHDKATLLLRNVFLWHAISLLFTWFRLSNQSELPEEEREELSRRLDKIKVVDPNMTDPDLLRGLIDYYFSYDSRRKEAVNTLRQALNNGVNVPEVINLVDREEKLFEQERKSLDAFLKLVKKYLNDTSIPVKLRERLKKHLNRFPRFKELEGEIKLGKDGDESIPSLQDIQTRGELLSRRVNNIVKPKLDKADTNDTEKIRGLLEELDNTTEKLVEGKNHLEKTEQELMLMTGEFLFQEEELLEVGDE